MGIDCILFDGKEYYSLDRWYVFENRFASGKKYTKEEIIERLSRIIDLVELSSDKEWEDVFICNKDYYMRWIMKVKEIIEKSESDCFVFYTDTNMLDEYYEKHLEKK